jgi:hypothetical protein
VLWAEEHLHVDDADIKATWGRWCFVAQLAAVTL